MVNIVLESNGVKIGVNSNKKEVIMTLIEKFGNYFNIVSEKADFNISYLVYELPIPLGEKYKELNEGEFNYVSGNDDNLFVFMKEYDIEKEDFVKRIFTNYYIKVLQKLGYTILHGACVSKNDQAIIICGDKRAGKTTTLLNFLKAGYDFIANDRIAVKKIDNEFIVQGIPFSMGIILEDALNYPGFDIANKKIGIDKEVKKVYLESDDISKIFDIYAKSYGIVKGILVPKYNPDIDSIQIEKVENNIPVLGNNIMYDDAIPSDKNFINDLINVKYTNPFSLLEINTYKIEQNADSYPELDEFVKNNIITKGKTYKYEI